MKRCCMGIVLVNFSLCGISKISRNPFAPISLIDNELVATAYIHTSQTHVNFMVRGAGITATFRGKKPLQLYTS